MVAEPKGPYHVVYTGVVRNSLRALGQKAKQRGLGVDFQTVLKRTEDRLRSDPSSFGEPRSELRHLGLQVRAAGTDYFYLRFAVDTNRQIVYVLHCVGSARLAD
jgi:hypothetical protein